MSCSSFALSFPLAHRCAKPSRRGLLSSLSGGAEGSAAFARRRRFDKEPVAPELDEEGRDTSGPAAARGTTSDDEPSARGILRFRDPFGAAPVPEEYTATKSNKGRQTP